MHGDCALRHMITFSLHAIGFAMSGYTTYTREVRVNEHVIHGAMMDQTEDCVLR